MAHLMDDVAAVMTLSDTASAHNQSTLERLRTQRVQREHDDQKRAGGDHQSALERLKAQREQRVWEDRERETRAQEGMAASSGRQAWAARTPDGPGASATRSNQVLTAGRWVALLHQLFRPAHAELALFYPLQRFNQQGPTL
jgi:hypothetical protein